MKNNHIKKIESDKLNVLTLIIARGGSKSIPRKNLADIGGKPLIGHTIEIALNSTYKEEVIVSTEDVEIAKTAELYGAKVPFKRPFELAEDLMPSLPVVQHAITKMETINQTTYDIIIYLQPTSPLCRPIDIDRCVNSLINECDLASAVAVTEVDTHPFKMKRITPGNELINYIDQGFEDMRPRQSLPKVYRRAGSVYASRRKAIMENNTLVGEPCRAVIVPQETAIDIDTQIDLELARILYKKNNSGDKL